METKILLTSFTTWLPHQQSNSSDDLLAELEKANGFKDFALYFLRNLPVDVELATQKVVAEIDRKQPNMIICCGMAERRSELTVESQAWCGQECLKPSFNLEKLGQELNLEISDNAGKFVCEGLYYQLLKYLLPNKNINCIFVHVPLLEYDNLSHVVKKVQRLIAWLEINRAS